MPYATLAGKLGIRSRAQLADALQARNGAPEALAAAH
jgi:hypothetical protein